jgi:hypothetical protein
MDGSPVVRDVVAHLTIIGKVVRRRYVNPDASVPFHF